MSIVVTYEEYCELGYSIIKIDEYDAYERKSRLMLESFAGCNLGALIAKIEKSRDNGEALSETEAELIKKVKIAICNAADAAYELHLSYSKALCGIKSESNDGASLTFVDENPFEIKKQEKRIMCQEIRSVLGSTGLLYRGVR